MNTPYDDSEPPMPQTARPIPRPTRSLTRLLTTALAATLPVALIAGPAPAAPAPVVVIDFGDLDRGAAPQVPVIEGGRLLDGDVDLALPTDRARFLGMSGDDYVVLTFGDEGTQDVRRITPAGASTVLITGDQLWTVRLSRDGSYLVADKGKRTRTVLKTYDATTGARTARKAFPHGFASVLDATADQVVASSSLSGGTWIWEPDTGATETLTTRWSYRADLDADRLAYFDKDPYDGGCSVLTKASDPDRRLWRSCSDRVEEFGPRAKRLLTVAILSDGIGPGGVSLRTGKGRLLVTYGAPAYFGALAFEDKQHVLLETTGRKKTAFIRCAGTACEKATKPRKAPVLRTPFAATREFWQR